ncbi:MAG: glycosyltransferase family 2 protein, partial [Bacteroidota bacterium]|nr:glycosyltransferase family 2 protein [Bacteroidota bacterium]
PVICVGSTLDESTGKTSYGGSKLMSKKFWKSNMMEAPPEITKCDFANANIMLVPKEIVKEIGVLSAAYTHSLADYDYSLKAKKSGFAVVVAPGFLGSCVDDHGNNWKSSTVSLKDRIAYLKSPKGLAYSEYLSFIKTHFPNSYPLEFCKLWLKTFFPFMWDMYKK